MAFPYVLSAAGERFVEPVREWRGIVLVGLKGKMPPAVIAIASDKTLQKLWRIGGSARDAQVVSRPSGGCPYHAGAPARVDAPHR